MIKKLISEQIKKYIVFRDLGFINSRLIIEYLKNEVMKKFEPEIEYEKK